MSSEITAASGLAGRYATALLDLAENEKVVDVVADDLKDLQAMIEESDDLTRLLRSPVITRADQLKAISALMDKAGMNALTKKFISVIANNRRLFALASIIKAYLAILSQRRGEVTAVVTSATELNDKQVKDLGASLKKITGSDVAVQTAVDPDLLGGLVVKVGSQMFDSSLRTKLQHLSLAMKGVA